MKTKLIFAILAFAALIGGCSQPQVLLVPPQAQHYISEADQAALNKQARQKDLEQITPKARAICLKHPDFDADTCATIAKHQVKVGFTPAEVRLSWGNPVHINSSFVGGHTSEQWVYGEEGSQLLYFDDGLLASWQNEN